MTDRFATMTDVALPQGRSSAAAPLVLVVDDDPTIRLLMVETLGKAGFEVHDVESGEDAIAACERFTPDLVLLDVNMPGIDGISACRRIRAGSQHEFPIIMVTSVDDATSIHKAFEAGATDFILKPLNWPLFQRRLDSVLAEWQRAQQVSENSKRISLLEKVAPEKAILVSRSGEILSDLKHPDGVDPSNDTTLDDMFGVVIARRFRQRISGVLKTRRHNSLEFVMNKWGNERSFEAQFMVEGRDRVIVMVQDVTHEKRSRHQIYDLAYFDEQTELPNRHLFERSAESSLTNSRLHETSLVFISVTFENLAGKDLADQQTMMATADRLRQAVEGVPSALLFGEGHCAAPVARVNDDCFVVALQHRENGDDVTLIRERVCEAFSYPVPVGNGEVTLTPRFGVSNYPADGESLKAVMKAADTAMREAARNGRVLSFFTQATAETSPQTRDYGDELRTAIDEGQLELFFQPRMSLPENRVTCIEALLRWNHPMRGYVDVQELLYLAKATGLISVLGDWVLENACVEAANWGDDDAPRVSINLSQEEFARPELAQRVLEVFEKTEIEPSRVELEFTEAALQRSRDGLADLQLLKNLGVGLLLDDFGTGHSSLASLNEYPIDALKIDSSFVQGSVDNDKDAAVCKVVISMAQILGMQVIAEGVETTEQLEFLKSQKCDEVQGFLACKPLPAHDLAKFMANLTAIM